MPVITEPIESRFLNEDNDHSPKVRLARSPHPYHRQSLENSRDIIPNGIKHKGRRAPLSPLSPIIAPSVGSPHSNRLEYFDTDSRKRRKISTSPSGSGTEADDERGSLLKGLPAPPAKPRKGLKESGHLTASAAESPLLTPSYIDIEERKVVGEQNLKIRGVLRKKGSLDDDGIQKVREKLTRRRRAELLRRLSETICIFIVGYITYQGTYTDATGHLQAHKGFNLPIAEPTPVYSVRRALFSHHILVAFVYIIYPIRVYWYLINNSKGSFRVKKFQLPAAFDPAPLLYPVLLPIFAVVSLTSKTDEVLITNIILSLSSIPPKLIPLNDYAFKSIQWMLSIVPLLLSTSLLETRGDVVQPSTPRPQHISNSTTLENLVTIPLLHQSLVPTLGFLTTTSLLPAELQLLSIALINLLLFSTSPQAVILKALLWIGPLSILLAGRRVLKWSVAIARVPSWRFRPSRTRYYQSGHLLPAIDDYLGGRLTAWGLLQDPNDSSDEGDIRVPRIRHIPEESVEIGFLQTSLPAKPANADPPLSSIALDDDYQLDAGNQQGVVSTPPQEQNRVRRHTMPSTMRLPTTRVELRNSRTNSQGRLRSRSKRPNSFLALTVAQAQVLKRLYASYTYILVITTIAFPIKLYVSQVSLRGEEPVGWALGYLFGDLPSFRLWTHLWNLERWICLPPRNEKNGGNSATGWADGMRQNWGAANTRLMISAYCATIVTVGICIVLRLSTVAEVDTRRKIFHGMMVAMFLPTIFIDPAFAALALTLVLAIFLLLDLFRASQLPPVSKPLTYFLAPYVDGRDHRGPVIVSHIFLLIGCAIPLWMSLADTGRTGIAAFAGWDVRSRDISMISGVVCVGMGDSAASLIGRRYGRRKWVWSGGKSLEGSLAFVLAVVLGLCVSRLWLVTGDWSGDRADAWTMTVAKATVAATGASFTEAVLTGGNDNVVVPIVLWLLVRGLKM